MKAPFRTFNVVKVFSACRLAVFERLVNSADPVLAAIAAKELAFHRDHAAQWTLRLAGGTDYSRQTSFMAPQSTR